jgi:hypothetical protein
MRLIIVKVDDAVEAGLVYQEMFPGTEPVPARSIFAQTPVTIAAYWSEEKLKAWQARFAQKGVATKIEPDSGY